MKIRCGRARDLLAAARTLAAAATAQQPPNLPRELGDLSISELLEIEVDSVYGASRARAKGSASALGHHRHHRRRDPALRLRARWATC